MTKILSDEIIKSFQMSLFFPGYVDAPTRSRQLIDDNLSLLVLLNCQLEGKCQSDQNVFIEIIFQVEQDPLDIAAEIYRRGVMAVTRSLTICDCFAVTYGKVIENLCMKICEAKMFGVVKPPEHEFVKKINDYSHLPVSSEVLAARLRRAYVQSIEIEVGCHEHSAGAVEFSVASDMDDAFLEDPDSYLLEDVPILASAAEYATNVEMCFDDCDDACIICTGDYNKQGARRGFDELVVRTRCCGKLFHDKCLRHAVCEVGPARCPMCRFEFKEDVIPQTPDSDFHVDHVNDVNDVNDLTIEYDGDIPNGMVRMTPELRFAPTPPGSPHHGELLFGDVFQL